MPAIYGASVKIPVDMKIKHNSSRCYGSEALPAIANSHKKKGGQP
jgi:hypothetical protein